MPGRLSCGDVLRSCRPVNLLICELQVIQIKVNDDGTLGIVAIYQGRRSALQRDAAEAYQHPILACSSRGYDLGIESCGSAIRPAPLIEKDEILRTECHILGAIALAADLNHYSLLVGIDQPVCDPVVPYQQKLIARPGCGPPVDVHRLCSHRSGNDHLEEAVLWNYEVYQLPSLVQGFVHHRIVNRIILIHHLIGGVRGVHEPGIHFQDLLAIIQFIGHPDRPKQDDRSVSIAGLQR